MSPTMLLYAAALFALNVNAQDNVFPATPLAAKHFSYPSGIPQKVDTDVGLLRGTQAGYNICNSGTEGPNSLCQTSWVNSADDFCLWAPREPNSVVGDIEGSTVAWCTKAGHGTRIIPAGALTGVQFMRTNAYIQVVGFIDQTKINIKGGDYGGEMDPHGADLRGNPMGGLMYTSAFGNGIKQSIEWTNFMGSNSFCIKVCDPANAHDAEFCEHRLDRIGCAYNMPNAAQNNVFESCLGDTQDYPGVYTDAAGAVQTYKQPGEGTVPTPGETYTPRVPASSQCVKYNSAQLFAGGGPAAPTLVSSSSSSAPVTSSTASSSSVVSSSVVTSTSAVSTTATSSTPRQTTTAPVATSTLPTGTQSGATPSGSNAAETMAVMSRISIAGVVFSAIFLS